MTRASILAACALAVVACKDRRNEAPPPPVIVEPPKPPTPQPGDRASLIAGKLPEGDPTTQLVMTKCQICHSTDYLVQQRLSEAAWKKTVDKMRKFGVPINDDEAATIVAYAARNWTTDLPERTWPLVAPPAGALPAATR